MEHKIVRATSKSLAASAASKGKFTCHFCKAFNDDYMVTNEVWSQVASDGCRLMCLSCLKSRLGRPLTIEDFPDAPINIPIFIGFELASNSQKRNTK